MSLHSRLLKHLHFQIKHADRSLPSDWFEASLGLSVKTCIEHWFAYTEAARWTVMSRGKTGRRGVFMSQISRQSFMGPDGDISMGPLSSPLTWRCHTMGHNLGHLWAALTSVSLLCHHGG